MIKSQEWEKSCQKLREQYEVWTFGSQWLHVNTPASLFQTLAMFNSVFIPENTEDLF